MPQLIRHTGDKHGVTRLWSDFELGIVECDAGSTQERTYVVPVQPGLRLRAGDAIIESEYSACDEGCYRGLDATLVKPAQVSRP